MQKDQRRATRLALLTVFLWSTVATAFKFALNTASPIQVLVVASFVSMFVLLLLYVSQSKRDNLLQVFRTAPIRYLLAGAINPVLYYLLLFGAYDRLPAQIAQPINYTWGIVLALLAAPILDQKLTKGDGLGLLFCYLGVVILVTRLDFSTSQAFDVLGLCLVILSTVFWAVYWLLNAKLQANALTSVLLCFLCASPWLGLLAWLNWPDFNFDMTNVLASVYIGLFEMSISFVLWLKAMQYATNTAKLSSLIYLSPFMSLVFIGLFVGESIYPTTVLGLVVICLGLGLQQMLGKPKLKGDQE